MRRTHSALVLVTRAGYAFEIFVCYFLTKFIGIPSRTTYSAVHAHGISSFFHQFIPPHRQTKQQRFRT